VQRWAFFICANAGNSPLTSNDYNRFGRTKYLSGNTSKEVYRATKSHINYVAIDSGWEGIAAKTIEELPQVISYVKNQFLGFAVPYVIEVANDIRDIRTQLLNKIQNINL
jgi:hypothetical protein